MSEGDYLAYQRAAAAGMLNEARETTPPVFARLTDETEWPWKGQLNFLDNRMDRGAGTIRARATFVNPGYFVTPGQFGRIRIPASQQHVVILVPDGAVVTDQSRKVVMTVKEDGTVEPKVVHPGPMTEDGLRIIRSGLEPSDRVIINGLVRARPGAKVTPQPGQIETAARQ
jgi:RND family efflux transporter MFP subunit